MTVAIVTDSSCDLPESKTTKHQIRVVPLTISFDEESFVDREELSVDDFWKRITTSPNLPKTAAPSPGAFQQAFEDARNDGATEIVCLCLSSKLSATYQAAVLAAKSVDEENIHVVDTLSLTTALGALVLHAAQRAEEGESARDVVLEIERIIPQISIFATLDTLENLKKGGRIGGASAFVGNLLSIKPIIAIRDGEVVAESKQRTRSRAITYLLDKVKSAPSPSMITVCGGLAPEMDVVVQELQQCFPGSFVLASTIGPVIGTYGGPGVLGVTFVSS